MSTILTVLLTTREDYNECVKSFDVGANKGAVAGV